MDQFQIGMLYNGLFISNAIYMAVFIFLLWMMFRRQINQEIMELMLFKKFWHQLFLFVSLLLI